MRRSGTSSAYRLPVSFSPPVPGGAVCEPAALAGRRSGALGTAALQRAPPGSNLAEDLSSPDAVATRCRALKNRPGKSFESVYSTFILHSRNIAIRMKPREFNDLYLMLCFIICGLKTDDSMNLTFLKPAHIHISLNLLLSTLLWMFVF